MKNPHFHHHSTNSYRPARAIVPDGSMNPHCESDLFAASLTHEGCRMSGTCPFDTGAIQPGKDFTIPSLPSGRYSYYGALHPIMTEEISAMLRKPMPRQAANKDD